MTAPTSADDYHRRGFRVQRSRSFLVDGPVAYRISKDGRANIIGGELFEEIAAADDHTFVEFATTVLLPTFPHPFAIDH